MIRCNNCGHEVNDGEYYCPSCGATVAQPQQQQAYQQPPQSYQQPPQYQQPQYQQPQYQQPQYQQPYQQGNPVADTPNGWLNAVGCCIPLVGLILYFVMKGTTPNKAKGIGKWAIIGFGVNLIATIFYICFLASLFSSGLSGY